MQLYLHPWRMSLGVKSTSITSSFCSSYCFFDFGWPGSFRLWLEVPCSSPDEYCPSGSGTLKLKLFFSSSFALSGEPSLHVFDYYWASKVIYADGVSCGDLPSWPASLWPSILSGMPTVLRLPLELYLFDFNECLSRSASRDIFFWHNWFFYWLI